jgi:hypothetical protein
MGEGAVGADLRAVGGGVLCPLLDVRVPFLVIPMVILSRA